MSTSAKKTLVSLKKDFYKTMSELNKKHLVDVLEYLGDEYYNKGVSLITDEEYDRLRETLIKKFGDSTILHAVGAKVEKQKIKLPFFMGSMDKIKPDKNNLEGWKKKYDGKVCISEKLDGISALIIKKDGKKSLYTRGDGIVGQDISHMLSFIQIGNIPTLEEYVVRGELIISKANYDKVKEGKRGARQMVSGLANQKTMTKERMAEMALIEFVAYEVIIPDNLKPSEQFTLLAKKSNFALAKWNTETSISIEKLSTILTEYKQSSKYEVDGIIIAHDKVYPRVTGRNPEHAFAFKMSFAEQSAVTEVLQVIWDASKDGYLKPTVNFEPVNIGGVIIQYATGFNASFIESNRIGPGALIEIIRSGDVIPYIKEVKSAAPTGPSMPTVKWHWNETHVDALLNTLSGNADVEKKALLYFANTLDINFCGEGTITRLHDAGIKTIQQLLNISESFLLDKVDGFKKTSATKLVEAISEATKKATITQWAVGSGIFGRGIGTKRVDAAFAIVPKSLEGGSELVEKIMAQGGWSKESAEGFVAVLPHFKTFMETIGFKPKVTTLIKVSPSGKLKGEIILFTGFHPKDIEAEVIKQGGEIADSWNKKITILVVKDISVSNEKTKKALAAGIPVITAEQLIKKL